MNEISGEALSAGADTHFGLERQKCSTGQNAKMENNEKKMENGVYNQLLTVNLIDMQLKHPLI